ncbi:MAG: hypothetical protein KDK28_01110, partial [Maritimibacter sp.]|nr:hypothetical protein [Maritimibacter sp.]
LDHEVVSGKVFARFERHQYQDQQNACLFHLSSTSLTALSSLRAARALRRSACSNRGPVSSARSQNRHPLDRRLIALRRLHAAGAPG